MIKTRRIKQGMEIVESMLNQHNFNYICNNQNNEFLMRLHLPKMKGCYSAQVILFDNKIVVRCCAKAALKGSSSKHRKYLFRLANLANSRVYFGRFYIFPHKKVLCFEISRACMGDLFDKNAVEFIFMFAMRAFGCYAQSFRDVGLGICSVNHALKAALRREKKLQNGVEYEFYNHHSDNYDDCFDEFDDMDLSNTESQSFSDDSEPVPPAAQAEESHTAFNPLDSLKMPDETASKATDEKEED